MVADALSRKSQGSLSSLRCREWKLRQELQRYNLLVNRDESQAYLYNVIAQLAIQQRVIDAQGEDQELQAIRNRLASSVTNGDYNPPKTGICHGVYAAICHGQ